MSEKDSRWTHDGLAILRLKFRRNRLEISEEIR